jgi:threonine aldolase
MAANSLAVSTLCKPYHGVVCHELAHIETDECGGPEFFSGGTKLLTVSCENGKVDLRQAAERIARRTDVHYPKPKALSITQPTELGTVYATGELREIGEFARENRIRLHMDGARFANAVVSLGVHPSELSWKAGVDVLCLGGTKNGMGLCEAVVFFNTDLAEDFSYRCKQAGQLASKMRLLTAPWPAMLESGAWHENARRANSAAAKLCAGLSSVSGLRIVYPCEANAVFVEMEDTVAQGLRTRGWHFYDFIGTGFCRFMCSWDTADEDINLLVSDLLEITGG